MAGSISLSLSQQFDSDGRPLAGGLLYFYQSGTTTPQTAYQDSGLTLQYPNPIVLDASGRVPAFYLADGFIKVRLTDSTGVAIITADELLVIGPSSGSGGGGGTDATTVLQTGDIKHRYGTGTHSGWVRANGRTVGSATSGATERANSDAQSLFEFLWATDSSLTVSTGRGATASADWLANKTIILPDFRGTYLAGMDDMGSTAASRLTSVGISGGGTTLGVGGGAQTVTLATTHLPSHAHSFSASGTSGIQSADHTHGVSMNSTGSTSSDGVHSHTYQEFVSSNATAAGGNPAGGTLTSASTTSDGGHSHSVSVSGSATSGGMSGNHAHSISLSGTSGSTGSGTAFSNCPPTKVVTIYIKL